MIDKDQLARERALFRYTAALDRGDDATVAAILLQAESDPLLSQLIIESHVDESSVGQVNVWYRRDGAALTVTRVENAAHVPLPAGLAHPVGLTSVNEIIAIFIAAGWRQITSPHADLVQFIWEG